MKSWLGLFKTNKLEQDSKSRITDALGKLDRTSKRLKSIANAEEAKTVAIPCASLHSNARREKDFSKGCANLAHGRTALG